MKNYLNHNGKLIEVSEPALPVSNHSYRYGDGLFETMKMIEGEIPLFELHIERLFYSMQSLGFRAPVLFSKDKIQKEITGLAKKNNCLSLARVRLVVSRGNGGLNDCDDVLQYTIECMPPGDSVNQLNENGYLIDVFPDAIKSCDKFSNLKSTSYLSYVMAAQFAKTNRLNDALVLNQHGRISEASIANIFWIKNGNIYTPPLSEGCIAGVMRKWLIGNIAQIGVKIGETPLTIEELQNANEVFLSNAVYGLRWVKQFRSATYQNIVSGKIFHSLVAPLFS